MTTESLAQLVSLLPDPTLLTSSSGVVLATSRAADRLRLVTGSLVGRRLADLDVGEPGAQGRFLRLCARSRDMLPGTLQLRDGTDRPLSLRAWGASIRPQGSQGEAMLLIRLASRDQSGSPFLVLNQKIAELSGEITRRLRAERELQDQRNWLEVTLGSIGDAVIATDEQGRVTLMNSVAERLTGWPLSLAHGRSMREVFPIIDEQTESPLSDPIEQVLATGQAVGLSNHTLLIARDGTRRPIDDAAAPIRGPSGPPRGVVMIFRDVADRRAMEGELRQRAESLAAANHHKNEFLAVLAHELRNPLAAISNALDGIESGVSPPGDVAWSAGVMRRQVRHLVRMVDDLLDLSRLNFGKIELRRERADLGTVVRQSLELIRPKADARGQRLLVAIPEERVDLDVDPMRLEQVLWNLLNNAVKYSGEGGTIEVAIRLEGETVVLEVRDDGIGISAELLPRVFDLFTQGDTSLAHSQGGLGVGLALVRTLVTMHGGTVEASSEGPGRGCRFTIRLPRLQEAAASAVPESSRPGSSRSGRRILVVEDQADLAESLARMLRRWGNEVHIAYDGREALERVREIRPDAMLLDIGLPVLDGREVSRRLRDEEPSIRPERVIALSGYGCEEDRLKSIEAGFDMHIVKPPDIPQLRSLFGPEANNAKEG